VLIDLPTMPVVTLAGSEENSMGRGGLDQSRRRHSYEVDPCGPADPDDEDWGWLDDLPMPDEALPEDAPAEADGPLEIELSEADIEEFLANHTATEEQVALLELFRSGIGDSDTVWANLVESLTDSFILYMTEEANFN
jgi:hypothetical protein